MRVVKMLAVRMLCVLLYSHFCEIQNLSIIDLETGWKGKKLGAAALVVSAEAVGELHNYFIGSIAYENHFQSS